MIPLTQAHKILSAIGLVRADNEAQHLAARILADPLVASRVQEFIFSGAGAAPEALAALHPLEKSALFTRLRIAGGAQAAAPRGKATWAVTSNGMRKQIRAACSTCNEFLIFQPNMDPRGSGHLTTDFVFSHCGQNEVCPLDTLRQWYEAISAPLVVQALPLMEYTKESVAAAREEAAQKMASQDRIDAMKLGAKI